jgi:hypothetical protein
VIPEEGGFFVESIKRNSSDVYRVKYQNLINMKVREEKLEQIIHWAENNPDIRAVLLTSSLVNPYAPVDDFSDLDVELVFENRNLTKSITNGSGLLVNLFL